MYICVPRVMFMFSLHCLWFIHQTEIQPVSKNITSQNSVPNTLSCYGIHCSTRLIYFAFLLHTWQTILSHLTWEASSREMPETWEHFNCWAGYWSNGFSPGVLKACLERLTPLWPPENEVKIETTKLQYPLDIEVFLWSLNSSTSVKMEQRWWKDTDHLASNIRPVLVNGTISPHYPAHWCVWL